MKPNEVPEISLREVVTQAFDTLNNLLGVHECKLTPKDRRIIQNALACYGTCIEVGVIDDEYTDDEIVNVLKKIYN